MRTSIDVIVVAEQGNSADRHDLSPTQIQNSLEAKGYRVRSVTILDTNTGLTGSFRKDRIVHEDKRMEVK